jgi:predicted signal transduction protein with EAL and GGDEF domain
MIAGAIVSLAHSLGMQVVAEGVESMAQIEFLRLLGCNMIQGYVLSRPLPAIEFERFIQAGQGLPLIEGKHAEHAPFRIVKAPARGQTRPGGA